MVLTIYKERLYVFIGGLIICLVSWILSIVLIVNFGNNDIIWANYMFAFFTLVFIVLSAINYYSIHIFVKAHRYEKNTKSNEFKVLKVKKILCNLSLKSKRDRNSIYGLMITLSNHSNKKTYIYSFKNIIESHNKDFNNQLEKQIARILSKDDLGITTFGESKYISSIFDDHSNYFTNF